MDKQELAKQLKEIPERIRETERVYREACCRLYEAKHNLLDKEGELAAKGKTSGKNELQRAGQLWPHTKELHKTILAAEIEVERTRVDYYYWKHRQECLLQIGKLLAP